MAAKALSKNLKRNEKPIAIDLFAGCGGLTVGLKKAGFNVLGAVEIDAGAASTYKSNHRDVLLRQIDIKKLPARTFMRELGLNQRQLDLLAGCPPCQGFSKLRTRNGSSRNRDGQNQLVLEMLRFVRAFLPKAIMMENVPDLATKNLFRNFRRELRKLGYRIKYEVKDASEYGVPQRRRRLILLASRGFDIQFADKAPKVITVEDAIKDMKRPGKSGDVLHDLPDNRRSDKVKALIRDIPKNGGSRGDLPKSRQLKCHQKSLGFNDVYGRMSWNKVSPTITGGCSNPSKGRFLHPTQNRTITLREAALLQGFPKKYSFDLSMGKQAIALMIGNALPPEFIRRHALEIRLAVESR